MSEILVAMLAGFFGGILGVALAALLLKVDR